MSKHESHGVRLTRFLEKEWDALYTNRGAWCRKVGLADSTVYRWSQGVKPDMDNMILVAEGLGRPLTDILFHAGYLDETAMRLRTAAPARERVELADVIRTDQSLDERERKALLAVHEAFSTPMPSSGKRTVRVTGRR